jgi:hypothetical protein
LSLALEKSDICEPVLVVVPVVEAFTFPSVRRVAAAVGSLSPALVGSKDSTCPSTLRAMMLTRAAGMNLVNIAQFKTRHCELQIRH